MPKAKKARNDDDTPSFNGGAVRLMKRAPMISHHLGLRVEQWPPYEDGDNVLVIWGAVGPSDYTLEVPIIDGRFDGLRSLHDDLLELEKQQWHTEQSPYECKDEAQSDMEVEGIHQIRPMHRYIEAWFEMLHRHDGSQVRTINLLYMDTEDDDWIISLRADLLPLLIEAVAAARALLPKPEDPFAASKAPAQEPSAA